MEEKKNQFIFQILGFLLFFIMGPGLIWSIVHFGKVTGEENLHFSQNYSNEILDAYNKDELILCGKYTYHSSRYGSHYTLDSYDIFSKKGKNNDLSISNLDALTGVFYLKTPYAKEYSILDCEIYDKNRKLETRRSKGFSLVKGEKKNDK